MDPLFLVNWRAQNTLRALKRHFVPDPLPESFARTKSVFIHVPKAAGLSITTALYGHEVGHRPLVEIESGHPEAFAQFFKFGFVRNPWDRLVSAYKFLCHGGMLRYPEDRRFGRFLRARCPDFDHFVLDWLDDHTSHLYVHFVPQAEFLRQQDGQLGVDFLGHFESIEQDFSHVAARINPGAQLRRLNASGQRDYRALYTTPEMVDRVADVYRSDIDLFGYAFEQGAPEHQRHSAG